MWCLGRIFLLQMGQVLGFMGQECEGVWGFMARVIFI